MRDTEMKKILAGLGIATLMSASGVSLPTQAHAGSGWGANNQGAVSAEDEKQPAGSGWGGQSDGDVSTEKEKKPAASGWGGHSDGTVGTDDEEEPKKKPAASGWGGSNWSVP